MPISIYPPILASTQPAFLYTTTSYDVRFTLQKITSFNDIGHIQIRIVRQANNRSVVNTSIYPDGTIYKAPSAIRAVGKEYSISILNTELIETWQPGYLYKIQMRFGTTSKFNSVSDFATWKQEQIDKGTFSEWSTVMVIKAITPPTIYIKNAEAVKQDVVSTERTEATLTPIFYGSCEINTISKEAVDKYKFDLYKGNEIDSENLLESSGWLQHNSLVDSLDEHRFKTVLISDENYTVTYEVQTINGYSISADPYHFLAAQTFLEELEDVTLRVDSEDVYCRENGCINIHLTAKTALSGNYVITRTSEKTDYQVWEDLQYLTYSNKQLLDNIIYQDFTIESGIKYKYAIQQENAAGLRTSPTYEDTERYHIVNFEYSYLYRDGIQFKLKFNQQMSSFKHTVLRTKQDTLGDKYPHLVQNGQAYYAEFPVTGLISFKLDDAQTFLTFGEKGFYYKGELVIPSDKFIENDLVRVPCSEGHDTTGLGTKSNYNELTITTDLIDNNVFVERIFREKAEEFLNDFEYKLYKSATEGNIVVGLMNVSLTPNNTLGRMIFEFSATAYEVLENTIENLNEYGIIDIGRFTTLASDDISKSFGQVSGIYESGTDIYAMIKQQEEISIDGGYKLNLKRVSSIWIEQYPELYFTAELLELDAKKAELANNGESTAEVDAQIKEYKELRKKLSGPISTTTIISVNGKRIVMLPNKVYHLDESVSSINLISAGCPIIVNYICDLTQIEDASVGVVSAIDASRIWGQVSGVFSGTDKVLKTYNYNYKTSRTLRIYNLRPDASVIYDKQGNRLVDNTNFNVYQTINIYDIIKEETQKQVEFIYNTRFYLDTKGQLTDGSIYYTFGDITEIDIEADEGTTFYIGKKLDGSDRIEVKIGPSCHYRLSPISSLIRYVALKEPQFCVINYKCLTSQMKLNKTG